MALFLNEEISWFGFIRLVLLVIHLRSCLSAFVSCVLTEQGRKQLEEMSVEFPSYVYRAVASYCFIIVDSNASSTLSVISQNSSNP